MDPNEILVLAFAAGASGFYAIMVFLTSRRRKAKPVPEATAVRRVPVAPRPPLATQAEAVAPMPMATARTPRLRSDSPSPPSVAPAQVPASEAAARPTPAS